MNDWNHDGKVDREDQIFEYCMLEEMEREEGSYSGVGRSGSGGGVFKGTVIVIVIILLLAFVTGVGVPGAVWGFFAKVLLVVGFFTVLSKL